ncbi:hypothetical protein niasHT_035416 [Heterodera trifolii]|uniref:Uncharacterized protein n=1 Tax=Heterodera trifolii TaxID=157864 RepID=A0ABD2I7G3_9BILA
MKFVIILALFAFAIAFGTAAVISPCQFGVVLKNVAAAEGRQILSIELFCHLKIGNILFLGSTTCESEGQIVTNAHLEMKSNEYNEMKEMCANGKIFITIGNETRGKSGKDSEKKHQSLDILNADKKPTKNLPILSNERKLEKSVPNDEEEWLAEIKDEVEMQLDKMISQELQIAEPSQLKNEDKWLENWDEWSSNWDDWSPNLDKWSPNWDELSPKREKMTEFEKGESSNAKSDEKQQPQLFMKLFEMNFMHLIDANSVILDMVGTFPLMVEIYEENGGEEERQNAQDGGLLNVLLYCYKMMHITDPKHLVIFGNSNLLGGQNGGAFAEQRKKTTAVVELGNLDELQHCWNGKLFIYVERGETDGGAKAKKANKWAIK